MNQTGQNILQLIYSHSLRVLKMSARPPKPQQEIEMIDLAKKPEEPLGLRGLQTVADVDKFIKSDEGIAVLDSIEKKISDEIIKSRVILEQIIKEAEKFASAIKREMEQDDSKKDLVAQYYDHEQTQKLIKEAGQSAKADAKGDKSLEDKSKSAFDTIKDDWKQSEEKYKDFGNSINKAETEIEGLEKTKTFTTDDKGKEVVDEAWKKKTIEHLTERIKTIGEEIERDDPAIQEKMKQLMLKKNDKADKAAEKLFDQQRTKAVQAACLADMLDVVEGKKNMYKADGSEAENFKDAAFFVPPDKKILFDKKSNIHYLVSNDKNITLASLSDEGKQAGEKEFHKSREKISSVMGLVNNNHSRDYSKMYTQLTQLQASNVAQKIEVITPKKTVELGPIPNTTTQDATHAVMQALPKSDQATHVPGAPTTPTEETIPDAQQPS